jgi:Asp-tRNA(Asn)/Glu-tRNA(Gln) amidotransferase A subunit family amidase
VKQLARRIRDGELTPREAVEHYLERIEAHAHLNAYITVRAAEALAEADAAAPGPLHGVPLAVKDVIDVAGTRTTAASRILAGNVPTKDAPAVRRLRDAGAVILGKLNTHEFAYGATNTSAHFGPARNPHDPQRIAGGSSGGSGVAAAADLAAGTLGTDTAGSIRIPACFCGVVGHRPTQGLVPAGGVVPTSWSFDTVGPIAQTAEDCALLLEVISGRPMPLQPPGELRVGLVTPLQERADPRIAALVAEAAGHLGPTEPVEPPLLDEAGVIQQLIMLPEATAAHLPWLRTRLADYGADVRARLLAGLLLPATAYPTGLRARRWYVRELRPLLERYDLLAAPAMPTIAPRIADDALPYRRGLIPFNSPWSLAGLPTVSVPCGLVDGLPAGLALVGRPGEDAAVLGAAHAIDAARSEVVYKRQSVSKGA